MNNRDFSSPVKIAVVGAGNVGASFAYALLLSGLASDIVLIDANRAKAEGEAMDLAHSAPFAPSVRVRAGDYADCAGAAVTVVTAGANQKPGESRLDLGRKNAGVFAQIIPSIVRANPDGLLLLATNPVDVLTRMSIDLSGLPPERVLGSGTILDTARFRHFIGAHLNVDARSINAWIIGEHGDSSVPVWSAAAVGGVPVDDFCRANGISLSPDDKESIYRQTRDAAQHIISRKGATFYAIGAGLLEVVAAIVRDTNTVLPVGTLADDGNGSFDTVFGFPTVVNRGGASRIVPLTLNAHERAALGASVEILRASLAHARQSA